MPLTIPDAPRCSVTFPKLFQFTLVPKRIAGLPETVVLVTAELAIAGELAQRGAFPGRIIAFDVVDCLGLENEKTAVDPAYFIAGLFFKTGDLFLTVNIQHAETTRWLDCGNRSQFAVFLVKCEF